MVKKTSFFERLFRGRRGSSSASPGNVGSQLSDKKGAGKKGDRIPLADQAGRVLAAREGKSGSPGQDAKPRTNGSNKKPGAEAVSRVENKDGAESQGKVLSRMFGGGRREEAVVALTDGFKDLSTLLSGIKDRMDQQSKTTVDLNEKFVDLPGMAKAQVQFMTKISEQISVQKEKTGELLDKLAGLPDLLKGIHNTLEKQAKAEERSEKTLADFRGTMKQIHQSIGTLSAENKASMKQTTESFERTNSRTSRVFEESQKQAYKAFETTQAAQIEQIGKLVQRSGKMNGMLVFLLIALVVSMVVMISILAGK